MTPVLSIVSMVLMMAFGLAGYAAAERNGTSAQSTTAATSIAGWYLEHAGKGQFQPCGQPTPLQVATSADLPARAKAFGLTEDTPVYVRVRGTIRESTINVTEVEQFGSPTPVRNCGLNGVVTPAPGR